MTEITINGWKKPTVGEVQAVLEALAQRLGLDDYKQVHRAIGISEHSLKRWRTKADTHPESESKIRKSVALFLWSCVLTRRPIIAHRDLRGLIDEDHLMNAENYQCPDEAFFKRIIGINAALGMSKKEVAATLRLPSNRFGSDIKEGKVSYITYCSVLMLCGFDYWQVLGVSPDAQAKALENKGQVLKSYRLEKLAILAQANQAKRELAERYLQEHEFLKTNEAKGYPLSDLKNAESMAETLMKEGLTDEV